MAAPKIVDRRGPCLLCGEELNGTFRQFSVATRGIRVFTSWHEACYQACYQAMAEVYTSTST